MANGVDEIVILFDNDDRAIGTIGSSVTYPGPRWWEDDDE